MCGLVHVGHVYFVVEPSVYAILIKTLLHQQWSQMKAVVQYIEQNKKYLDLLSIVLFMCNVKML